MTQLWISTTNQNKLNEFRNLLAGKIEIHSVAELKHYFAPPENGKTFVENARIKAKTLKALKPGTWVVADDSGLEVDGLGGLPGLHSARYAGEKASDAENVAKLLKMVQIRSNANRTARFKCAFVAYDPSGHEHVIETAAEGRIAAKASGKGGFGYDPVFIPEGQEQTYSELGAMVKNQISHRAKAISALLALIELSHS